ncbi:MAG: hypothetical protein V3T96_03945 [Thermodesulfobacteriota bacterium]
MPRQARLDVHGTLHHVIIRGIEKRQIEVSIKELQSGSRRQSIVKSRKRIARQLVEDYVISLAETARQLGVSTSAISKSLK